MHAVSIKKKTTLAGKFLPLIAAFLFCLSAPAAWADFGGTVLPTDVEPLPGRSSASSTRPFTTPLQMRLWQHMPASMFFSSTVETTMRIETNPYQYPTKRNFLHANLPPGTDFLSLSPEEQFTVTSDLAQIGALDNVHRITPNMTAGWAFNPNTQVFINSFFLRDSLCHNYPLNTNTGAVGIGGQQNIPVNDKISVQVQAIARELFQSQQVPVLDYLPGITAQYNPTSNLNLYLNALLQVRFAHFVSSYMRELDPFYTWGGSYTRGNWTFLASGTFLSNFRKPFSKALTPINNDTVVCDFEIDRPLFSNFPGLVVFCRAEPVWNFRSKQTPGLAGMDFRFYYGVRLAAAKPALNDTIKQLRQRYKRKPADPSQEQQPELVPSSSYNSDFMAIRQAIAEGEQEQAPTEQTAAPTYLSVHGALN